MKESYVEGIASHIGPKSCVGVRKGEGEALTGVNAGLVLSRVIVAPPQGGLLRGADAVEDMWPGASQHRLTTHAPGSYSKGTLNLDVSTNWDLTNVPS